MTQIETMTDDELRSEKSMLHRRLDAVSAEIHRREIASLPHRVGQVVRFQDEEFVISHAAPFCAGSGWYKGRKLTKRGEWSKSEQHLGCGPWEVIREVTL